MTSEVAANIEEYTQWAASDSVPRRSVGLLNLAGTFHYGWHGAEKDYDKAADYYLLLCAQRSNKYRNKGVTRFISLLSNDSMCASLPARKAVDCCSVVAGEAISDKERFSLHRCEVMSLMRMEPGDLDGSARAIVAFERALACAPDEWCRCDVLYYKALCYKRGEAGIGEDVAQAVSIFEEILEIGEPYAMPFAATQLGDIYLNGVGGLEKDYAKAEGFFSTALSCEAFAHDADRDALRGSCYYGLAYMYAVGGSGFPANPILASEYCDKAIELGHASAYKVRIYLDRLKEGSVSTLGGSALEGFLNSL